MGLLLLSWCFLNLVLAARGLKTWSVTCIGGCGTCTASKLEPQWITLDLLNSVTLLVEPTLVPIIAPRELIAVLRKLKSMYSGAKP